jgi:hypothetical protein
MTKVSTGGEGAFRKLGYFERIRKRRAWTARVTILTIILGLLVLNVYLMFLSTNAIVLNIDMARIEQSDQADLIHARIARVERHIGEIEARQLALLPDLPPPVAPPVEPPMKDAESIAIAEAP